MKTFQKKILAFITLIIIFKIGYVLSGSNELDNYLPFFLTSDGWNKLEREMDSQEKLVERANPAAVFCDQAKGILEKVNVPQGGESYNCVFPNGEKCDEWALYRGECSITNVSKTVTYSDTNITIGVIYRIFNETAILTSSDLDIEGVELKSAISASGTRFVSKDGKIEAWEHQGEFTISIDGKQFFLGKEVNPDTTFNPTDTYKGMGANGMLITLEFGTGKNSENNIYRLTSSKGVTQGEFNYERGWGNDENATIYVLDWKKPQNEQRIFVIKSNSKTLVELDQHRVEVRGEDALRLSK